jgi:hypothetical protein
MHVMAFFFRAFNSVVLMGARFEQDEDLQIWDCRIDDSSALTFGIFIVASINR